MTHPFDFHEGALLVTREAHLSPYTTKSDFARQHATAVALAASLGWITTVWPCGVAYTNSWRVTPAGLARLAR